MAITRKNEPVFDWWRLEYFQGTSEFISNKRDSVTTEYNKCFFYFKNDGADFILDGFVVDSELLEVPYGDKQ